VAPIRSRFSRPFRSMRAVRDNDPRSLLCPETRVFSPTASRASGARGCGSCHGRDRPVSTLDDPPGKKDAQVPVRTAPALSSPERISQRTGRRLGAGRSCFVGDNKFST
jgi:hypothetical protein